MTTSSTTGRVRRLIFQWAPGVLAPGVIALTCDLCAVALATCAALSLQRGPRAGWADVAFDLTGATAAWLLGTGLLRHYDADRARRGRLEETGAATLLALGPAAFMLACDLFVPDQHVVAHPALLFALLWPCALVLRLGVFRRVAWHSRDVLIAGAGPLAQATAAALREARRFEVKGHLALDGERACVPVVGRARDVELILRASPVAEVYIAADPAVNAAQMQQVVHACEQVGMPFALPAWTLRVERGRPSRLHRVDDGFVHFRCLEPAARLRLALKHVLDLYLAALALALLSPLLVLVAVLVKLDSRGPVFFRQSRVGQFGRPFWMFKFRSMVDGAEKLRPKLDQHNECSGPVFKMVRDPRITRVGRFIRRTSIDELPQIVNVLRGEMSVVGPRPPLASEVAKYQPWQVRRLSVRPGLTCLWQVSGRSEVGFDQWMLLDLRYIDNWRMRTDLSLIARTVPAVLGGRGAS